jgi:hypothetical protein
MNHLVLFCVGGELPDGGLLMIDPYDGMIVGHDVLYRERDEAMPVDDSQP